MGNEASTEGGGGGDIRGHMESGMGMNGMNHKSGGRPSLKDNANGQSQRMSQASSPSSSNRSLQQGQEQRDTPQESPQDPRPQQQQHHHRFPFSHPDGKSSKNAKKIKAFLKQKAQQISDKAALVQSQSDFLSSPTSAPNIHAPLSFQKKTGGGKTKGFSVPSQRRMKEKQRKQNAQKQRGGQPTQQQDQHLQHGYRSQGNEGHYGRGMKAVYSPQEHQQNWMAQQHYQHQQQQQQQQQQYQQRQSQHQYSNQHTNHQRGGVSQQPQGYYTNQKSSIKPEPKSPKTQTVMNVMYHAYPPSPRRNETNMQFISGQFGNMSLNSSPTPHHSPEPAYQPKTGAPDGVNAGTSTIMIRNDANDEEHWQHAWEEDEGGDSGSDDDDNNDDSHLANSLSPAVGGHVPQNLNQSSTPTTGGIQIKTDMDQHSNGNGGISTASSQLLRPTLDAGHASSSAVMDSPSRHYQPQHSLPLSASPISPSHLQSYSTLSNENILRIGPHRIGDTNLVTRRVETELEGGTSGVNWETSPSPSDRYEKPNIIMFLPLLRVLGKGSFGKVSSFFSLTRYIALDILVLIMYSVLILFFAAKVVLVQKRVGYEQGRLFAMKILKKSHLLRRGQIERTRTERKVLSLVDHPFIMKLHFAFQSDDKLFLVLDYCSGGELFFHLTRYRKFSEAMAQFYAAELLLALGHLHSKGIIYRDLKPENVLFDSEGHVKLGDFGLAKDNIRHPYKGASSVCGTPEYMAPEILLQMGHGFCVDYWGLGMLIFEMMTGLPPWYTTDQQLMMRRLKSAPLEIPAFFSPQSRSCVYSLLQRDPRRRLGVRGPQAVADHMFFRSLDFRAILKRHVNAPIRPCGGWKAASETSEVDSVGSSLPFKNKAAVPSNDTKELRANDIDAATANFSDEFTRMAVNSMSEDHEDQRLTFDHSEDEELNENTFIGFTFDEQESKQ